MSRKIRWIAIPAVLVALTVGTAQAWPSAPARQAPATPRAEGLLDTAWDWLASLFRLIGLEPADRTPSDAQEKAGCGSDPNGHPINCES
jgi:hypothetical protein